MKHRLLIIFIGIFFLFSVLIAHYFKIQVIEGEKWQQIALSQHELIVKEPFRRGSFYANTEIKKGHPGLPQSLVFDVAKFNLFVDPDAIPKNYKGEIATQLASLIKLEEEEISNELQRKSRYRRVAMWLERETKEQIQQWWLAFAREKKIAKNALYFVTDYQRSYPFGKLLGQVLHTIREVKEEKTLEGHPTGGLEAYFNDTLKGKLGKRKLLRSPLNQFELDDVIEPPQDGADIYLTVNHCIQAIVEEELEKGVVTAKAKGGWAIMMDPHTGEILALAQYPFFDPTHYRDFFNHPEKIEDTKVKALTDAFEIGSIMKPITLAISMKANVFDPAEKIDTRRASFPGRGRHLLCDIPSSHTALNMAMAVQKSSNVYMAQVIERVIEKKGSHWYHDELVKTFGFGEKSGIELPAEALGLVPTPGKKHPNGALEWSTPTPYSLAIGYNIMATSLQMLRAYAVFANGGYLVTPTLVKKIMRGEELIFESTPFRLYVLDEAIATSILSAIKYTTKPGGTGVLAAINGYTEAGKTGTAEKLINGVYSKEKHISSFIGCAPANLHHAVPTRFVLIVTIDEPAHVFLEGGVKNYMGGRCAAPVFREIAKRTLEFLGVPPDDPFGYPSQDPRYDEDKADWMKEVRELKSLYDTWNKK